MLSPIVFTGLGKSEDRISIRKLSNVAGEFFRGHPGARVMKVDIEGAEYKIFRNVKVVNELATTVSVAFISFHPGFNIPQQTRMRKFRLLTDHYKVFKNLSACGSLSTTNGLEITSTLSFISRIRSGCFDWVWVPNKSTS